MLGLNCSILKNINNINNNNIISHFIIVVISAVNACVLEMNWPYIVGVVVASCHAGN